MTTPTILSSKYLGTSADFRHAKVDRSGSSRMEYFTATLTAVVASTTIIGLVPFQKGARFHYGASAIYVSDIDSGTNVTIDYGYVYDDAVTYTSVDDAFSDSSTIGQSAGIVIFNNYVGMSWIAAAPGWIAATVNVNTTTTGTMYGQITLSYDQ